MKTEQLASQLIQGNTRALAKGITLIEGSTQEQQNQASKLLELIIPHSGKSRRIGITGIPGVGKSTFIDAFGQRLIDKGQKVAVLAVDPSSALDKGSILGDKTRMENLARSPRAFIRPSPSQGNEGGVARKTRETLLLCEAAGFKNIIVETVGVGQSEAMVHSMVDLFLLLQIPGAGDDLQGIKRGILELVDFVAITKADGQNINNAKLSLHQLKQAFTLVRGSAQTPPIHLISSLNQSGFDDLEQDLSNFWEKRRQEISEKRLHQQFSWFDQELLELFKQKLSRDERMKTIIDNCYQNIKHFQSLPTIQAASAVREIFTFSRF